MSPHIRELPHRLPGLDPPASGIGNHFAWAIRSHSSKRLLRKDAMMVPVPTGVHSRPDISVVIPAYNEQHRLSATLQATTEYLRAAHSAFEIAVVNDGSSDDTAGVVREFAAFEPRLRLLEYDQNRGKGFAVRYGMTRVSGRIRLFMDADNSTSVDQIGTFLPLFDQGFDVVIGSRHTRGANIVIHQTRWKETLGKLGNIWIQCVAVPGIHDTQAGFKAFSARAAGEIFPRLTIDGWGFDVELLAVARLLGYRVAEQPIRWLNDDRSHVASRAYLRVLGEVAKVRWHLLRGTYRRAVPASIDIPPDVVVPYARRAR
jgi:dolichyl-phosphate beta-glucosyltransferase